MSKFKIGDRVKIMDDDQIPFLIKGEVGIIVYIDHTDIDVRVVGIRDYNNSMDGSGWYVYKSSLALARIRNTKIARKVYPNYTEDGEWLLVN